MLASQSCKGIKQGGDRCLAPPLRDSNFCFWHDPEHQRDAAEARRLGGLRRKREGTLQGAYDLETPGYGPRHPAPAGNRSARHPWPGELRRSRPRADRGRAGGDQSCWRSASRRSALRR
jgi:hypothetical protein